MRIQQIVAVAGDGRLRDGSECQEELRAYLSQVPVAVLEQYATACLTDSFEKSGQVLQDLVNELGRRLEYEVANGRYQGTVNAIGFDGVWHDPNGVAIVVEVKTTDAYRLSLDTVAGYRADLLAAGQIPAGSSILMVVGRSDTGELEAQVRGSRHAWDIRLISVESLLKLVHTKESAESPDVAEKIRRLLTPVEYTRLDGLVEVVFSTVKDVEQAASTENAPDSQPGQKQEGSEGRSESGFTSPEVIRDKRAQIVAGVGAWRGVAFVQKTRALFWTPDGKERLVCTVSKRYEGQGATRYWYAYHPAWHEFLTAGEHGWFVLGCVDLGVAFAIPVAVMAAHLADLHTTARADGRGEYYHIKINETPNGGFALYLPHASEDLPLALYRIEI